MLSRMRSARVVAREIAVFGMRMRNSSPPQRVRESDSRMAERMQLATSRMTWSPTGWPKVSLIRLKWSISSRIRVMGCPYRRAMDLSLHGLLKMPSIPGAGQQIRAGQLLHEAEVVLLEEEVALDMVPQEERIFSISP